MKNWAVKLGGLVATLAVMITAANASSICFFMFNQPELPEQAKRLRKF